MNFIHKLIFLFYEKIENCLLFINLLILLLFKLLYKKN